MYESDDPALKIPGPMNSKKSVPDNVEAPGLSGPVMRMLSQMSARQNGKIPELNLLTTKLRLTTTNPEEAAIVLMSLILSQNIAKFSGTSLNKNLFEPLIRKYLSLFEAKEVMLLEIEAYEILMWVAKNLRPDIEDIAPSPSKHYIIDTVNEAIARRLDLRMSYYTGQTGIFNERIVTPVALLAETYLVAYCHNRKEERTFRLSRIARLSRVKRDNPDTGEAMPVSDAPVSKDELAGHADTSLPSLFADDAPSAPRVVVAKKRKKAQTDERQGSLF